MISKPLQSRDTSEEMTSMTLACEDVEEIRGYNRHDTFDIAQKD